jgi:hypothetical protein
MLQSTVERGRERAAGSEGQADRVAVRESERFEFCGMDVVGKSLALVGTS